MISETLRAKNKVGITLWQQGFLTAARKIQEEVVAGFIEHLGVDHEDTLRARDNLGRTISKFWEPADFRCAYNLHMEAVTGLENLLGPDHVDTLFAKESLARVMVDLDDEYLDTAENLVDEVLEKRKSTLGKEHHYTLLAMANAAIIKCANSEVEAAEDLLRTGLDIANRNLGINHVGTLTGRMTLGSVLIQQKRYADAEKILLDTTERQKHMPSNRGNYHPDRMVGLVELAKCYRLQGKIQMSIETCDESLDGFESYTIPTQEHMLERKLKEGRMRLVRYQEALQRGDEMPEDVTLPEEGRYHLYCLF